VADVEDFEGQLRKEYEKREELLAERYSGITQEEAR